MDQLLLVGMKHGPGGISMATKRLKQLVPALTPGDIWKRMRHLRETGSNGHRDPSQWAPEILQVLKDGYRQGGSKKQEALKTCREQYPGIPGYVISRFARQQGWTQEAKAPRRKAWQAWTRHEEELLRTLVGYLSPSQIAHKLRRTESAVRSRLKAQGLSGRVKDGVSLRGFQEMFHIGNRKAYAWIANGVLRARDLRISSSSLAQFRIKHEATLEAAAVSRVTSQLRKATVGYSWERVGSLLGVSLDQVQGFVAARQLRVVDTFVTDKALEEFSRNCVANGGPSLNLGLMNPQVLEWLVKDYEISIPGAAASQPVSRFVKQALVTRVCGKCKKEIRGNVYFAHIKDCRGAMVVGR